jgi:predicted aspartyl protease
MATLRNTLLLGLSASASATVQLNIARNPAVQAAQLEARSNYLRSRSLEGRATSGTVTEALTNDLQAGLYAANITVGTPGQSLSIQIDTGSSDVWVPAKGLEICSEPEAAGGGCDGGTCE